MARWAAGRTVQHVALPCCLLALAGCDGERATPPAKPTLSAAAPSDPAPAQPHPSLAPLAMDRALPPAITLPDQPADRDPAWLAEFQRAAALYDAGRREPARQRFLRLLERRPGDPSVLLNLGQIEQAQGRLVEAAEHFAAVVAANPNALAGVNNLAWLLATSPAPLRDPQRAVELAERAVTLVSRPPAGLLDTLAAAEAAAGDLSAAIRTAEIAVSRAQAAGERELAAAISERLAIYESGRSLVLPPPATKPDALTPEVALARYVELASLMPGGQQALARLGWLLASHSDSRVRDGALAVADRADRPRGLRRQRGGVGHAGRCAGGDRSVRARAGHAGGRRAAVGGSGERGLAAAGPRAAGGGVETAPPMVRSRTRVPRGARRSVAAAFPGVARPPGAGSAVARGGVVARGGAALSSGAAAGRAGRRRAQSARRGLAAAGATGVRHDGVRGVAPAARHGRRPGCRATPESASTGPAVGVLGRSTNGTRCRRSTTP